MKHMTTDKPTKRRILKMRGATQSTQVHFPSWQHSTFLVQSLCWEQEDEDAEDQNQPLMVPTVPSMVRSQASLSDTAAVMDEVMTIRNRNMGKVVIFYLNFMIIGKKKSISCLLAKVYLLFCFKICFVCILLFPFSCFVDFRIFVLRLYSGIYSQWLGYT